MSATALDAINRATAEFINNGANHAVVKDLIDEAKGTGRPPECDSARASILADKARQLIKEGENQQSRDVFLAPGNQISIYTVDKRIISMKVLKADDRKIKGKVLVLDGKKTGGSVLEIWANEINKIIVGDNKIILGNNKLIPVAEVPRKKKVNIPKKRKIFYELWNDEGLWIWISMLIHL